jgi:2-methylcitrate dehydratase
VSSAETIRGLAAALCAARAQASPPGAVVQAQLLLLDTIGCGIAGAHEEVSEAVAEVALREGSSGPCALIGRTQRASVLDAVLVNGVAVRVLDLNDYIVGQSNGQPEAAGHPSDNIPVALAVGAQRGRSGKEIIEAIITGYELYARIQNLMDRGGTWDGVSASALVAAAIAGQLMELDETRLAHALAIAASRAATPAIVRRGSISATKSISNALVAQAGVQAALLAERGITGPLAILEGPHGLRELFPRGDVASLVEPFPSDGAVMRAHIKAYPCVNTGQSAVAAALKLQSALNGNVDNIARLEIVMADYPSIARQQADAGRTWPTSREAADHSFPFLVAVSLIDGVFGVAQFENERWRDPQVAALMAKTAMSRDAALNPRARGSFPCLLRAHMADESVLAAEVLYPPGFSHTGLDARAVTEKFHATTASILELDARERIVDAAMQFHHSPSTATLDAAIATEGNT